MSDAEAADATPVADDAREDSAAKIEVPQPDIVSAVDDGGTSVGHDPDPSFTSNEHTSGIDENDGAVNDEPGDIEQTDSCDQLAVDSQVAHAEMNSENVEYVPEYLPGHSNQVLDKPDPHTNRFPPISPPENFYVLNESMKYAASRGAPEYTPRRAELGRIPSPSAAEKRERARQERYRQTAKAKVPSGAVKLATVSMSKGGRGSIHKHRSHFVENPEARRKVITWDEANNARPPLRIDMDGPTACSYSPRNKPLYETNAPQWTFGSRCYVEKDGGGSRTSWEKSWFQSPHVYQQKTDFHRDRRWPSPSHYQLRPTFGPKQQTLVEFPSFSIGVRRHMEINKKGSETEPAPGEYESPQAVDKMMPRAPAFSHGRRRGGTVLWTSNELNTPGPGSYNPHFKTVQTHRPAYTIQGARREKSHMYGPFATF